MTLFDTCRNRLEFDGVRFRAIGLNDELIEKVDKLGGVKRPTKAEPSWKIPALPFHAQQLSRLPLKWTKEAAEHGRYLITEAASRIELSRAIKTTKELSYEGFGLELHPYQKAGVEYMLRAKRCLLADEMGLGKSAQALAYLFQEQQWPVLIICPATLKYWWQQEGERCLPNKRFQVLDSKSTLLEIQMADICIVNYDLLAKGWATVEKRDVKLTNLGNMLNEHPFKAIVFDEMHALKSHSAQRTKACRKLAELKPIRIGITGTPVTNRPAELAPIAQILGRMDDLGGWLYFMRRYCKSTNNRFNQFAGSNHEKELNERMRSSFYIRRSKDDVKLELPPLTRSVVPVQIDNRAEYKFAEEELIQWVKQKAEEDQKFRESISHLPAVEQHQLLQNYIHDKAQRAKKAEAMIKIGALKRITASGKIKAATQWIDDFLENDEKLLVFATHKNIIDALKDKYPKALTITSDMSAEQRQASVVSFQNNGCNLLIGAFGTSAGSAPAATGLTLTAASNILFLELGWTSAHHDQAEARCYRMGQSKPVTAHYIIGKDTIEHRILGILDSKREICDKITDGIENDSTPPLIDILMSELAG